jgi:hypothetical protein
MIEKEKIVIPLISAAAAAILSAQSTPRVLPNIETPENVKLAICPWPFCGDHRTVIVIPIIAQKLQYTSWLGTETSTDEITTKSLFD